MKSMLHLYNCEATKQLDDDVEILRVVVTKQEIEDNLELEENERDVALTLY